MKDIQSLSDSRRINIKKVGVKTVSYPITVLDKAQNRQHTIATANMYVNLPHEFKGTHMSRLEAEASHLELEFPYFLRKKRNGETLGLGNYKCSMHGSLGADDDLKLRVEVPISLPIVEKKINRLPGSMGNWGKADVSVRFRQFFWIEDIILLTEEAVGKEMDKLSSQVRNILSVEELTRRVGAALDEIDAIKWFSVTVHNFGEDCSTFATLESCP